MKEATRYFKPALIAISILIGVSAGLWFLSSQVNTYGDALRQTIQTIKNDKAFESQYEEITKTVEATAGMRATLATYILEDERDTISFLSEMDRVATRQQVTLETVKLDVIETKSTFNQLAITFSVEGSEAAVMNMIKIFETLPYHGDVVSLSLDHTLSAQTGSRTSKATVALELSIQDYD